MQRFAIPFALLVAACGTSPQEEAEKTGGTSAPIIDGTASTTEQDSAVLIMIGGRGACTGTLVAPNLVLTARHCVTQTDEGALCKTDGTPYEGGTLGSNYSPGSLLIYRGQLASAMADDPSKASAKGKQLFVETTTTYCDADVAFILLDRNVSAPVAPVRLAEGAREGETVTAVVTSPTVALVCWMGAVSALGTSPSRRMSAMSWPQPLVSASWKICWPPATGLFESALAPTEIWRSCGEKSPWKVPQSVDSSMLETQ